MAETWRRQIPGRVDRFSNVLSGILRNFVSEASGAVAVITAVALTVVIGMAAISIELGNGLVIRGENQRIADIASYSGALAYSRASGSTVDKENAAEMAAKSIAALNGIAPEDVKVTYPTVPEGSLTVQAEINATQRIRLARILSDEAELGIKTRAVTLVGESSSACIVALAPDAGGIALSGGTFLRADDCGVASNAAVSLHEGCSTRIISDKTVTYGTDIYRPECVRSPDRINESGSGSVAQGSSVDHVTATRQDALDAAAAQFPLPSVSEGTSITFGWWAGDPSTANGATAAGCEPNPTFSNNKWTITCRNDVRFTSLSIPGGMTVEFILDGTETFNVRGDINLGYPNNGGNSLIIGDGSSSLKEINIGGDVKTAGGSCVIFGGARTNRVGGNIMLNGSAIFRPGMYAINGYMEGLSGGSACPGSAPITAQSATFILGGANGTTACGGIDAFCLAGGQANASVTPPSSGLFADFSVIGPLSSGNTRGAAVTKGSMGTQIKGLFYFPQGTFRADGGSSSLPPANECFQLVAAEIFITGGASITAGNCPSFAGGEAWIRLIQ